MKLPGPESSKDSQQQARKMVRLLLQNAVIIAGKQQFLELILRENWSWPLDQTSLKASSRYGQDGDTGELSGKICPSLI